MHAQHVLRTLCLLGDLVDVQIGGVGSQHRARFCKLVELTKHFLLDCHGFEYGFDDQIRVLDVLKADHTVDQSHALGGPVGGNAPPPRGPPSILFHPPQPPPHLPPPPPPLRPPAPAL